MLMLLMLFDSHLRSCCVVSEQLARLTQVFAIGQGILGWTGQEREEKGFDTVRDKKADRKSTRLNSSHTLASRMPSSA